MLSPFEILEWVDINLENILKFICRSCPHELNDNDNSSSGVSSDQEQSKQTADFVGGSGSNNGSKQASHSQQQQSKTQTTKFVTYLPIETSTPITKKSYDSESSESSFGENPENIVHMKKMLHPKLQAIFDIPSGGSYSSQTLPNR